MEFTYCSLPVQVPVPGTWGRSYCVPDRTCRSARYRLPQGFLKIQHRPHHTTTKSKKARQKRHRSRWTFARYSLFLSLQSLGLKNTKNHMEMNIHKIIFTMIMPWGNKRRKLDKLGKSSAIAITKKEIFVSLRLSFVRLKFYWFVQIFVLNYVIFVLKENFRNCHAEHFMEPSNLP